MKKRTMIQILASFMSNVYLPGFFKGKIYTGNSKHLCVPGLNCYSCPGAIGSCPIGSLQAILGSAKYNFSYYIFGIMIFFGVLLGRVVCGFLCMFGFIQDMLYKVKVHKITIPEKVDRKMRYIKYLILMLPVIILPIILTDKYGTAEPYFCKWICPSGTLEGGIPLIIKNEGLRQVLGYLFDWKLFLLVIFLVASMTIYRPFCKYICPLGAFYSLFNRFSFWQMKLDKEKCTGCKACERSCKMNVQITKNINSTECIRCGECINICRNGAISREIEVRNRCKKRKFAKNNFGA